MCAEYHVIDCTKMDLMIVGRDSFLYNTGLSPIRNMKGCNSCHSVLAKRFKKKKKKQYMGWGGGLGPTGESMRPNV